MRDHEHKAEYRDLSFESAVAAFITQSLDGASDSLSPAAAYFVVVTDVCDRHGADDVLASAAISPAPFSSAQLDSALSTRDSRRRAFPLPDMRTFVDILQTPAPRTARPGSMPTMATMTGGGGGLGGKPQVVSLASLMSHDRRAYSWSALRGMCFCCVCTSPEAVFTDAGRCIV